MLSDAIKKAQPRYFVTNPAVTVPCLRAMGALMERDRSKRIGAVSFESFTSHPFFAELDFEALERKEIPAVFTPSSDKTNFDATYDLEELLLEEAPLEARARRQKPRAELREDATAKEIREDELHRLIETMFEPFDYTLASYKTYVDVMILERMFNLLTIHRNAAEAIASATWVFQSDGQEHNRDTLANIIFRNPEDCLPTASSTPAAGPGHARRYSQPDISRNSPSPQNDGSTGRFNTTNRAPSPLCEGGDLPPAPLPKDNFPAHPTSQPPPPPPSAPSFHRPFPPPPPAQRPRGPARKPSKAGGVQMVLEETGSWSELADHSSTLPAEGYDANDSKGKSSNSGMLSFLSRKKGRDRSPKPQEPGVLGKEGARQIIS